MENVVRVEGLTKRFGSTTAVADLSFSVPTGSVFALLGNNGAGKTTTIRCLLGLEEPDEGFIEVQGLKPQTESVAIRRQSGYVPEERHLYEWMRPLEMGRFMAAFYPTWSQVLFESILENFGVPTDRRISQLSRGMKAQLDLALALAPEASLLILDEPTGGLDSLVRRDFLKSIIDMAGQGRTVLVSSHEIAEVERVADRGIMLYNSQLLWSGEIEPLKAGTVEVLLPEERVDLDWGPEEIIHQHTHQGRTRLVVRCGVAEAERALATKPGAEVRPLNLEEIFVAMLRGAGDRRGSSAGAAGWLGQVRPAIGARIKKSGKS